MIEKNNITFITDNFPPEYNAPAARTFEHCTRWEKFGLKVTIITCNPNFPHGRLYKGYKNKLITKENMNGLKVVRLWSYIHANKGFFKRSIDHFSFALTATIYTLWKSDKLIITTSPQFFTNFVGLFNKIIRNKKWILEVRDLWPESLIAVGSMNKGKIYNILEYLELYFYKKCDLIVTVTNSFKKNLIERGVDHSKIKVIKNAVNTNIFNNDVRATLKKHKNETLIGYVGTHGMAHQLEFILDAAKKLGHLNLKFIFVGDGAQKEFLIKYSHANNINNVEFLDSVKREEVPALLKSLDYGIVHLKPSKTFKSVIPSKIFELAAMDTPILNGVKGETAEIIKNNSIGLNYDPNSVDDFILKLNILIASNKQKYIDNLRSFTKRNNRDERASEMLEYIIDIS